MNTRFLTLACALLVIALCPIAVCGSGIPDDGPGTDSASDSGSLNYPGTVNPFVDPEQAELYDTVLQKLQRMKRTKSARHDNEVQADDDWFVVGGSLTNRGNGYVQANFSSFQGVENVARRIIEFQYGSHGSNVAKWKVFERVGDAGLAAEKADKQLVRFQRYLVGQERKRQRNSQRRAGGGGGRRC